MIERAVSLDEDDEPQPRGVPDDEGHRQAPGPASPGFGSKRERHPTRIVSAASLDTEQDRAYSYTYHVP